MQKKPSAKILEKYFKGDCNKSEIADIHSWYESFEHDRDDISLQPDDEKEALRVVMLNNIRKNIANAEINNTIDLKPQGPNRSLFYFIAGIAATLLIVFFLKYNMRDITSEEKKEEIVVNNKTNAIQKITLSDGSRVWLSPNSQLAYLKLFDKNSRQVTMNGEAFFEVTKDHKRPFSIQSGRVITKVWGTSFRIRAFKNEITKVEVVTGKVSVSIPAQEINLNRTGQADKKQEIMLLPDQEATYDNISDHLIKNAEIKDPLINIWKKVSVSFENTPMRTVFSVLNEKFKVHIKSDDQDINADSLNAVFTDESLPAILEMMKKILNVNYQVSGTEFVLISNK